MKSHISATMDKELVDALHLIRKRERRTLSNVLETAVAEFLDKKQTTQDIVKSHGVFQAASREGKRMLAASGRCLIDTNILLYATAIDDPRHPAATDIFDRAQRGAFHAVVSVQNLAEMYPNLTGPKRKPTDSPELASRKIESIARLQYLQVIDVTAETVNKALELCQKYGVRRQDYFDMQLVASMVLNAIPTLITENEKDFIACKEIKVVTPFD